MTLRTSLKILNYSVEFIDTCKPYLLKKLNYVLGLIIGIKGNLLPHGTATLALAISPILTKLSCLAISNMEYLDCYS
jgi:hypothetical protein